MSNNGKPNKLINEKSPYLLQHAYNPVDWYPWGEEAFEKARKEDKPIFLSIGYSTCHWCHVMEHESFEDSSVAAIMNEHFVSIKVDREERPDIDNIYMTVCQMMTGHGGWPLTIVMTPDKMPFFSGTYFPKESKFGRVGFTDLLKNISEVWKTKRDDLEHTATQVQMFLQQSVADEQGEEIKKEIFDQAFNSFAERFDNEFGGFGNAPKFPSPHNLIYLIRYWKNTENAEALAMAEKTLIEMRKGGMFDHIGLGFHRYSTDRVWKLPHFEKMLYDQAMLAHAYIEAYQATNNEFYKTVAEEIFDYVLRDMTSKEGGFYSAEDADSEGEEGKFYIWKTAEIKKLLEEDAEKFISIFNFTEKGNFEDEATKSATGDNIPHLTKSYEELQKEFGLDKEELLKFIDENRKILFEIREHRIRPSKDDKILTDWNGLMISALAKASRVFDNDEYLQAAKKSYKFITTTLMNDKKLLHRFRDGEAGLTSNIDDYSFMIWACLELYEASYEVKYLQQALNLNDVLVEDFWDEVSGGFYFTPDNGEELIVRTKEIYDGAIPSGNSVAILNMIKLSHLTSKPGLENSAIAIGKLFSENVEKSPTAFTNLLNGFLFAYNNPQEIIVVEGDDKNEYEQTLAVLRENYNPNKVMIVINKETKEELKNILPIVENYIAVDNKTSVYLCENYVCHQPIFDLEELKEKLKN